MNSYLSGFFGITPYTNPIASIKLSLPPNSDTIVVSDVYSALLIANPITGTDFAIHNRASPLYLEYIVE